MTKNIDLQKLTKTISALLLLLSFIFFVLGLYFPILSTKYQVLGIGIDYKEVRLYDSIVFFYQENSYLLALIILVFTIIFPIIKYLDLANRIFVILPLNDKISKILQKLDKWSMLDVFLVALLLLNYKMNSNIIMMKLQAGTNYIALAVIFRMLAGNTIDKYLKYKQK